MDSGFIQLIHDGHGPLISRNPSDKTLKSWGIQGLSEMVGKCYKLCRKYAAELGQDCPDDEFMTLFEKYSVFDDFNDNLIENEEC